ncbi:predicted protein [Streptomyces iranensis]|uniref:Uncharacterized protein n=1 Tax=Streptomyces iranensis TaxID=576784 RepID=A0A060ZYT8_9ACTN|nr:predicted protein [Streptomyces iranensis]
MTDLLEAHPLACGGDMTLDRALSLASQISGIPGTAVPA